MTAGQIGGGRYRNVPDLAPHPTPDPATASRNGHQEPPEVPKLLGVTHAGDVPKGDRPPELVEGLIRKGDLVALGAGRGVGKSWWTMGLAVLLAQGSGLFMGKFAVTQPCKVLFCHGELEPWDAYDRWKRYGLPLPEGLRESFDVWRIRVAKQRVTTAPGFSTETVEAILDSRVETTIAEYQPDVLIVDPFTAFYGGQENSNDEMDEVLTVLQQLQRKYRNMTIVLDHHFNKAGDATEPENLWRGAGRLADRAHTRVTLLPAYTAKQAKEQGMTRQQARRYAIATFLRRGGVTPDDLAIKLDVESGQWCRWRAPAVEAEVGSRIGIDTAQVAAKMPAGGWPSVTTAAVALGISPVVTLRLLLAAVHDGLAEEFTGPRRSRGFRPVSGAVQVTLSDLSATSHDLSLTSHDLSSDLSRAPLTTPRERSKTGGEQGK